MTKQEFQDRFVATLRNNGWTVIGKVECFDIRLDANDLSTVFRCYAKVTKFGVIGNATGYGTCIDIFPAEGGPKIAGFCY